DLGQRLAGRLRGVRLARAALPPREDVAVVLEAVACQRRQQLPGARPDARTGGTEILPRGAVLVRWQHAFQIDDSSHSFLHQLSAGCSTRAPSTCRMAAFNPLASALECSVSDPPWGVEADAIQTNLGRLPSRYDLVAAGSLHLGGVERAQGADAVRQRRTARQGGGRAQRRLLRAGRRGRFGG